VLIAQWQEMTGCAACDDRTPAGFSGNYTAQSILLMNDTTVHSLELLLIDCVYVRNSGWDCCSGSDPTATFSGSVGTVLLCGVERLRHRERRLPARRVDPWRFGGCSDLDRAARTSRRSVGGVASGSARRELAGFSRHDSYHLRLVASERAGLQRRGSPYRWMHGGERGPADWDACELHALASELWVQHGDSACGLLDGRVRCVQCGRSVYSSGYGAGSRTSTALSANVLHRRLQPVLLLPYLPFSACVFDSDSGAGTGSSPGHGSGSGLPST